MALTIRAVQETDWDIWQRVFARYASFYKTTVPEDGIAQVWSWIHSEDEPFWCDLAAVDGKVIGFVQYQLMHRSLGGTKVCYLSDLFVDPDQRGTGAGRALIDHVIAWAAREGIVNLRWLTAEGNATARRLYDQYHPRSEFVLYSIPVG